MAKHVQIGTREAARTVARKAMAGRSSSVMKPEYLELIENFRLMDDTFMSKCLENAPECIELMLRIIIGKKDLKVVKSQTEYPIKSLQGRGVRFDVFARDSEGKEYDIEIQRADKGAEPKRARYNSALMDANALKTGEDVAKLRDTYVIFITENDVIGGDKEIYQIDRMIRDLKCQAFGDGAHIIYVNGATRTDDSCTTCCALTRRRCILMFLGSKSVNSRIQKKGGMPCARQWKKSRREASVRICLRRRSVCSRTVFLH